MAKNPEAAQIITMANVQEVTDSLYERLDDGEKEKLLKLLISQQTMKRIQDLDKKGKQVQATIEEFTKDIEKRLLNKLVWQEVKVKILR